MTEEEHCHLLDAICGLEGMVVLSGYPSDLYECMLGEWERVEREHMADGAQTRTEVLWINPAAAAVRPRTLPLFGDA